MLKEAIAEARSSGLEVAANELESTSFAAFTTAFILNDWSTGGGTPRFGIAIEDELISAAKAAAAAAVAPLGTVSSVCGIA